jgi:thiamine pyrophosphate-dependent acetolactate synthase large subunit-like protein
MPVFYIDALARYKADAALSLEQINSFLSSNIKSLSANTETYKQKRLEQYNNFMSTISDLEKPLDEDVYNTSYLCSLLRKTCPADTIWVIEAVTQTQLVADSIRPTLPGTWINCGGGGLGWSGGAALGIKLAADILSGGKKPSFICQIVGDGTFLFTVPASVYWISQRYSIPILTIVLNNNGWNAPKNSLLLVHPDGPASRASREDMAIMFNPTPDYAGVAKAASGGQIGAFRCGKASELEGVLKEAVKTVQAGTTVVVDAHLNGSEGKYLPKE